MTTRHVFQRLKFGALAPFVVLALACEADPLADPQADDPQLVGEALAFEPVPVTNFEQMLDERAIRVEIELLDNELTAREVEIETDDELADEEEIRSLVTAVSSSSTGGTLTLELGGLEVTFDPDTRFRVAGGDDLSMDDFVSRLQEALDQGVHPAVKAERDPPGVPQDPDDASFAADELRLDEGLDQREIEINIDRDNLSRNDSPPPDGWVTVLGLEIALRVSEGITEIEVERPDVRVVEFEGVVTDVDLDEGTFLLDDGTLVRVIGHTDMMESDDHRHRLDRLAAVAEALREGLTIIAHGKGVVESSDPLVLVALRLGFVVDEATLQEFEGPVVSVDVENRAFTLEDGSTVRIIGLTRVYHTDHWDLSDGLLQRIADAIANGVNIVSHGVGVAVTDDEPPTLIGVKVKFGVARPPLVEFEGFVTRVDVENGRFGLEDGTIIQLPGYRSDPTDASDRPYFQPLRHVQEALDNGLSVKAFGKGHEIGQDPLTILARRVGYALHADNAVEFSGLVTDVDPDARTFTLDGGSVMRLIGLSQVHFELDRAAEGDGTDDNAWLPDPLTLVKRALDAGIEVAVTGAAVPDPADGSRGLVLEAVFSITLPTIEDFEGQVVAVDLDAGSFELRDGTVVVWPDMGSGPPGSLRPSHQNRLAALHEALEAGLTVLASGAGVVTASEPLRLTALWVHLEVDDSMAGEFEGRVASVDPSQRTLTLEDGSVVHVLMITRISLAENALGTDVLDRVDQALNDHEVHVAGTGLLAAEHPDTWVAIALRIKIQ